MWHGTWMVAAVFLEAESFRMLWIFCSASKEIQKGSYRDLFRNPVCALQHLPCGSHTTTSRAASTNSCTIHILCQYGKTQKLSRLLFWTSSMGESCGWSPLS
jgi:hypothetical protein